jgi:hypothetical protein
MMAKDQEQNGGQETNPDFVFVNNQEEDPVAKQML